MILSPSKLCDRQTEREGERERADRGLSNKKREPIRDTSCKGEDEERNKEEEGGSHCGTHPGGIDIIKGRQASETGKAVKGGQRGGVKWEKKRSEM